MTKTEAILRRIKLPKSIILIGGRPEEDFVSEYLSQSNKTDILWVSSLTSEEVSKVRDHALLAPKGLHRVVCIKQVCGARRDNQSTLLKLIEESPEDTRWVLSVSNPDRIIKPIISRSFVLDWVAEPQRTIHFQDDLQELIKTPSYLGIYKLHNRISEEAEGNMEEAKKLHMTCLSELMQLLPASKSTRVLRAQNEMKPQLRTEITFKSVLSEVLL